MKKNFEFTQDYLDSVTYSALLASFDNSSNIKGDNLFLWVFKYLNQFNFNEFFWKYLWINDTSIVSSYFENIYWNNFSFTFDNSSQVLKFEKNLQISLNNLQKEWIQKVDYLSLLYIATDNLSDDFEQYLFENDIDLDFIKEKIENLIYNTNVTKIWAIVLFEILSKTFDLLNLDPSKLQMMIDAQTQDKKLLDDIIAWVTNPDEDWDEDDAWNTQISSKVKQDDKKLTVEYFGTDLTKEAKDWLLDPVIWRDKEVDSLIYTLLRKTKNNPLLIWEAWVGKTAIIEWFAQRIVSWDVPERLLWKKVYMVDMGSLLAWTKYRWEFEARFKSILDEAADPVNNIILFIDELHTIIGAWNSEWSADAANMIKPMLSRGKIQLIWATTFDEYQKHIEKDAALKRRFQEIMVEEPIREDAIKILLWIREKFEQYHGVNISDEAIDFAIDYSIRYILNKHLPDKAIDLIDEACARKSTLSEKLKNNDDYKKLEKQLEDIQKSMEKAIQEQDYFIAAELKEKEDSIKQNLKTLRTKNNLPKHLRPDVLSDDIWEVLADKLWVPLDKITKSEISKLKDIDKLLKSKILWQDDTVDQIVKAVRRNRLSVVKRNRPIASFVFLWPSWVGKTYLAKLLAQEFFWDEKSLIRVDMSEFGEKHNVSRLIGSAPGYVWYDEWGQLTEAVRRKPYSIVLFDEIEKAAPDVLNILLQILDEWHLKDNKWRLIDFKNTIIILTSNIWSEEFGKKVAKIWFETLSNKKAEEEKFDDTKQRVLDQVKDYLLPEIINRFDGMIVFRPLSKKVLSNIFKTKLEEFFSHWKQKQWIKLPKYTDKKISEIIEKIYEPQYGARPLERYIYDEIEPALIEQVLKL